MEGAPPPLRKEAGKDALPPEQRAQIDAILATTLKKTEVMARVRAHIHVATEGGTSC